MKWFWRTIAIGCLLMLLYQLWFFLHICFWTKYNPNSSAFMSSQLSIMQDKNPHAELRHKWVSYANISNNLKRALIASEDAKFVDHEGFDWSGIYIALKKDVKKGKIVAGGSTISQQLAKNLFLSGSRSPWRKIEEALITVMMEAVMDKQRIFEIYLNIIEWGNGVFGAEAAARHYYHTRASQLTAAQSARLAAMVPNPRYYDLHRKSHGLHRKTAIIMARMRSSDIP